MPRSQILSLCLILLALPFAEGAKAEQEWKVQGGPQTAFSAAIYTDDLARLVVECRTMPFLSPEVLVTLVPPRGAGWPEAGTVNVELAVGGESMQMPMQRIGSLPAEPAYRWTGSGPASMAAIRKLAEAAPPGPLVATFPANAPVTFRYGYQNSGAMQDVVLRCAPSVVRARRQAGEMSGVDPLLTLERDANDKCRGGGVEDVWIACAERTEYGERLAALGMCYGRRGEAGYQQRWHRCGPTSNRR